MLFFIIHKNMFGISSKHLHHFFFSSQYLITNQIMYRQRLMKQASDAAKKQFTEYLLIINPADFLSWEAYIEGPETTPYANYIFHIKLSLTNEYPITPPKIYFKTRIFHPNIHFNTGEVCLDIIKNEWSPTWTLEALCKAIRLLMETPNEDSPLNCDAANLLRLKEKQAYIALATMYSREFAIAKKDYKEKITQKIEAKK